MTVEFFLKDTPLEADEALSLLEIASENTNKPIRIELTKIVGARSFSNGKLFNLAVKNNNKSLVNLAWKLATTDGSGVGIGASGKATYSAKPSTPAYYRILPEDHTLDDLISTLLGYTGSWVAGAALLIKATADGSEKSLKDIATEYVNSKDFPEDSKILQGFEYDLEKECYVPRGRMDGEKRNESFHMSRMYMSLREGLLWCRNHGLVDQKEEVSYGSTNPNTSPLAQHMQRVFYKVVVTPKGKKLADHWADMDKFIDNIYSRY